MANKKYLVGILAMVLVFGVAVVGCDNITIDNVRLLVLSHARQKNSMFTIYNFNIIYNKNAVKCYCNKSFKLIVFLAVWSCYASPYSGCKNVSYLERYAT